MRCELCGGGVSSVSVEYTLEHTLAPDSTSWRRGLCGGGVSSVSVEDTLGHTLAPVSTSSTVLTLSSGPAARRSRATATSRP
jgi:hypothetical protein